MSEPEENYHLTPAEAVERRNPYTTFESLEGLDYDTLLDIANYCPEEVARPDICLGCRAYAMAMDIEKSQAWEHEEYEPGAETLDEVLPEVQQRYNLTTTPVAERFAAMVHALNDLTQEMLEGPPIPPPGVTMDELALLVVATQKWIRMTEAGGADLSETQQNILNITKTLVQRLHRGDAQ